jgi:hypothetical protein
MNTPQEVARDEAEAKLTQEDMMEAWAEGFFAATFAARHHEFGPLNAEDSKVIALAMSKTLRSSLNVESGVNLAVVMNKMVDAARVALVQARLTLKQ